MVFVRSDELLPGMCLAKDISFRRSADMLPSCLKTGDKLTDEQITRIRSEKLDGAYVDTARSDVRVISSINQQLRVKAVECIHRIADEFSGNETDVQKSDMDELTSTVKELVDTLSSHKDILVNITDIKMFDDYTFHHCLSVAIMSAAIGIELGLTHEMLIDVGLAAILHDIGKTAVPAEIINKPGPLTEEEFAIVRRHPVLAAKYLEERGLVNENVYFGIYQHHEKLDGTGYPDHMEENGIHPYAKILAVADVYDALTSNRPYRTPSSPNEAIEYIMGGMGTHFDGDVIMAFLRKITPFPTGSRVKLSNGETAYVIKNYPGQPLRPVVAVVGTDRVYDLSYDMTCMSIVITGLSEDETTGKTIIVM